MLGGLAMKLKWRERRQAKAGDKRELEGMAERPNLVMAANTQVCWHKFCRYFDVEAREVPNDDEHLVLNVEKGENMPGRAGRGRGLTVIKRSRCAMKIPRGIVQGDFRCSNT